MDEAFGVANNKQYVELKRVEAHDYLDEDVQPMWLQLEGPIKNAISEMKKENEKMQKNVRTEKGKSTPTENIVNQVEKESGEEDEGASAQIRGTMSPEEREKEIVEAMKKAGIENATQEDIEQFGNSKVKIFYEDRGRGPFMDYDFKIGMDCIYINVNHDFYKSFLTSLIDDTESKVTFELFIAAFVRAIDKSEGLYKEAYDRLMTDWEEKLNAIFYMVRRRSNHSPIVNSLKMISMAASLVAILSLQTAMFSSFGGESESGFKTLMNALTGTAVCLFLIIQGIVAIRKANIELKRL